ncbi:hypothetical protein L195_g063796, partial [Trifolium pratense]
MLVGEPKDQTISLKGRALAKNRR